MRLAVIIPIFALSGCFGPDAVEAPQIVLPPGLSEPCGEPVKLPERAITQAETETWWGSDRIALRRCSAKHRAVIDHLPWSPE